MYLSSLVFYVVLTRILTQDEVGAVSLLIFALTASQTLTTLSIPMAVAKYVSEREWGISPPIEVVKSALRIMAFFTTPCIAVLIALSPKVAEAMNYSSFSIPLAIVFVTAYVLGYAQISYSVLWGMGRFRQMLLAYLNYLLLGKMIALFLAWLGYGVLGVSLGLLIGGVLFLILGWIYACAIFQVDVEGSSPFPARILLSYSLPLVLSASIMLAQKWVDVLVLYALTTSLPSTGIYYLSANSAWMLSMIWNAVAVAAFPRISLEWVRGNVKALEHILSQSLRLLAFLTISAGLIGASLAKLGVELVYGESYLPGAYPLALLLAFSTIPAWNSLLNYSLRALGKTTVIFRAALLAMVAELFSLAAFVEALGLVGAALARVLMTLTLFIVYYWAIREYVRPRIDVVCLARVAVFSVAVAVPAYCVDTALSSFNICLRFFVDLSVVLLASLIAGFLIKPLPREDFELLLEISPQSTKWLVKRIAPLISSP